MVSRLGGDMVTLRQTAIPKAPERFFINGAWVKPAADKRRDVISPVTDEPPISSPEATPDGLNGAVHSADPRHPFGVYRQSGKGRDGLASYLEVKTRHMEG
jgi:acyl-CoA reductase-like NAD-dependent aldehyde dehydrogenase